MSVMVIKFAAWKKIKWKLFHCKNFNIGIYRESKSKRKDIPHIFSVILFWHQRSNVCVCVSYHANERIFFPEENNSTFTIILFSRFILLLSLQKNCLASSLYFTRSYFAISTFFIQIIKCNVLVTDTHTHTKNTLKWQNDDIFIILNVHSQGH